MLRYVRLLEEVSTKLEIPVEELAEIPSEELIAMYHDAQHKMGLTGFMG